MGRGRKPNRNDSDQEPEIREAVSMPCPKGVSKSVRETWGQLVPIILEECDVRATDFVALLQLCDSVTRRIKASKELEGADLIHSSPNGALQTNPLLKVIAQCDTMIAKITNQFAMTPLARKKLKGEHTRGKKTGSSKFHEFLSRKPSRPKGGTKKEASESKPGSKPESSDES